MARPPVVSGAALGGAAYTAVNTGKSRPPAGATFLSCLCGSERKPEAVDQRCLFLSCLYGSEPHPIDAACRDGFLSCLYGSEQATHWDRQWPHFLSCLYGSELDVFSASAPIIKAFPRFSPVVPFFSGGLARPVFPRGGRRWKKKGSPPPAGLRGRGWGRRRRLYRYGCSLPGPPYPWGGWG